MTVKVWFHTVIWVERAAVAVLAATVNVTVPLPPPLDVVVSQLESAEAADHEQPGEVGLACCGCAGPEK